MTEINYTLNTHKIGTFTDVLNYCGKIYTMLNIIMPVTFKTGTFGLVQFEEMFGLDKDTLTNTANREQNNNIEMSPFGKISIGYNRFLDHFILETRRYQSFPISSGDIEFYIDGDALLTFKANVNQ